jgi:hypothetical protein
MDYSSLIAAGAQAYASYNNAQAASDAAKAQAAAAAAAKAQTASTVNWSQYLPWIIGGVVVLGMGFIGLIFLTRK